MKQFLLKYKHAWVFSYFIFYMPWYFGLQYRPDIAFHAVIVDLDRVIPFVPIFIYPYIYWFVFVAATIAFLFFYDTEEFYKCVAFLFAGMTICLIIFTIYPTSFEFRPEVVTGDPLSRFLVNMIYTADKPQNVFPSIHVYNSIGCAIALIKCKRFRGSKAMFTFASISAILITLSTMFIKQHSVLDAVGAAIVAIILYIIVYKIDWKTKFHNYKSKRKEKVG